MWVHRNQCCPEYKALSPLFERFSRVLHGYLSLQPGLWPVSRTRFRRKPLLGNGLKSPASLRSFSCVLLSPAKLDPPMHPAVLG
jgi:hypothetical protein